MLKDELSGVNVVRVTRAGLSIKRDQKIFNKRVAFADLNFFEVFNLHMIKGDINSFQDKGNVLINEDIAEIYFGEEDPLGKMLTIFNDKGKGFNCTRNHGNFGSVNRMFQFHEHYNCYIWQPAQRDQYP